MSSEIAIRPFTPEDVIAHYEAVIESKEALSPWMPWCHAGYSIEDSQSWIESQIPAFKGGAEYAFVVVDDEDRLVGCCGLNHVDRPNLRANLGYWTRASRSGRGIGSKAVKKLVDWAFLNTAFERLEVVVSSENHGSLRVAEKAGAFREGVLLRRLQLHCRMHDAICFSFTKSSWIQHLGRR